MPPTTTIEMYEISEEELLSTRIERDPKLEEQERHPQEDSEVSESEVAVAKVPTIEETLENSYGGRDEWNGYSGPMQLEGVGSDLLFDGERLWQNGTEITDEWSRELIEKWGAGEAYTFSWPETRGDEEFLCVGVGIIGEDGRPEWTNMETKIPDEDEEVVVPEEQKEPVAEIEQLRNIPETEEVEAVAPEEQEEIVLEVFAEQAATQEITKDVVVNEMISEQIEIPRTKSEPMEIPAVTRPAVKAPEFTQEYSHETELASIDRKYFVPSVETPVQPRAAVAEVAIREQESIQILEPQPVVVRESEVTVEKASEDVSISVPDQRDSVVPVPKVEIEPTVPKEAAEPAPILEQVREVKSAGEVVIQEKTAVTNRAEQIEKLVPIEKSVEVSRTQVESLEEPTVKIASVEESTTEVLNEEIAKSLEKIFAEPLIATAVAEKAPAVEKFQKSMTEAGVTEEEKVEELETRTYTVEKATVINEKIAETSAAVEEGVQTEILSPRETAPREEVATQTNVEISTAEPEQHEVVVSARIAPILRMLGIPHVIESERHEQNNTQILPLENFRKTSDNPAPQVDEKENERASAPTAAGPRLNGISLRRAA